MPARDLRNDHSAVLRRVQAGEHLRVTVDGRPVAELRPLPVRPRFMSWEEFRRRRRPADTRLADDLRELFPETTDDVPLP